jgi:hypothetical protein
MQVQSALPEYCGHTVRIGSGSADFKKLRISVAEPSRLDFCHF